MLTKSFLTALLAGLFLSLVAGVNAQAKTPVEILKPYKKYQAALQADNFEVARAAAEQAWQTSEKLLGDVKLTGDLAFNYGSIIKGEVKKTKSKPSRGAWSWSRVMALIRVLSISNAASCI